MALMIYNTLTRKKEPFKPLSGKEVRIYSCGPTVYDFAHIGNFRAYMVSDLLRRYLEYRGFSVRLVMNLTDVDDKTIKGSKKEGIPLEKFTERYKKAFFEDLKRLNIKPATVYPEATKHIDEMVRLVKTLIEKGYAYRSEDGSVYYDISKFRGYGKVSGFSIKGLKAGARVSQDQYEKEEARDFALWKGWTEEDGGVFWETEIGKGRPGWHIECSAMSMKYLGEHFDIHTGGVDLIFPHHENEVAQSEAATGKPLASWFVHNEHLLVEGRKMSKSLGNFYTLRDLLQKGHSPRAIRFLLLGTHYRQKLNFTSGGLAGAANSVDRLLDFMDMIDGIGGEKENPAAEKIMKKAKNDFVRAMDDDLNISAALAVVFDFVRDINRLKEDKGIGQANAKKIKNLMLDFDRILGVLEKREKDISREVEELIQEREKARKRKDFRKADSIREKLKGMGIILEDTDGGIRWKIRGD